MVLTSLHPTVIDAISRGFVAADSEVVYVLPTRIVDDAPVYSEFDTYTILDARMAGVNARTNLDQPRYLAEYDATLFSSIAFAIAADITAGMIANVGKLLLSKVRGAVRRGLVATEKDLNLRVSASLVEVAADGSLRIENLAIEGNGEQVVDRVCHMLETRSRSSRTLGELNE